MANTQQSTKPLDNSGQPPQPILTVRGKPVRPWLVLMALVCGFFMALLDATIVNIAIPTIQTSLNANLDAVSWVLSAYNLVFAVLLVTFGRFADQYGRKRIFIISMIVFSIGSLFCAMAETFAGIIGYPAINWLIGFRALQAIGAAGLNPISLAIIMTVFPAKQRGAAIGVWGALAGLASAVGPILGGFLIQFFDWRWIFFVNLPFCFLGIILVVLFVPETRNPYASKRIDWAGTITLSAAIFCLVLAIIEGNSQGWTSTFILSLFAATLVSLLAFVIIELRQKEPIVDFSLFKAISFVGANATMFLFGIAVQGAFLILILYFTTARGYDQLGAAYALLPIPLASFVVASFAGRLSAKINPHIMGILGMLAITIGFILLCLTDPLTAYPDIAWRSVFLGAGMGMLFQSQPTIALSEVPPTKFGVASGVFNTFRQIGFTLGVAVLISVFTGNVQTNVQQARTNSIAIVQSNTKLPAEMRNGIVKGLQSSSHNQSNASEANTGKQSTQQFDLTKLADQLPPQVPAEQKAAIRAELKTVNNAIANEFTVQTINAFKSSWWVAMIFAIIGVVSAIATYLFRRPGTPSKAPEGVAIIAD